MMNETPQDIMPVQPPQQALDRLHGIASENFDHYIIVVMDKTGKTWQASNNNITAYGMASKICTEINRKWYQGETNI